MEAGEEGRERGCGDIKSERRKRGNGREDRRKTGSVGCSEFTESSVRMLY